MQDLSHGHSDICYSDGGLKNAFSISSSELQTITGHLYMRLLKVHFSKVRYSDPTVRQYCLLNLSKALIVSDPMLHLLVTPNPSCVSILLITP